MKYKKKVTISVIVLLVLLGYLVVTDFALVKKLVGYNLPPPKNLPVKSLENLDFLSLPDNFEISVFAKDLDKPRVIAFDSRGRMLVSQPSTGQVIKLEDEDGDGLAEKKTVILENLRLPHGLNFYTDSKKQTFLYVAETHQVARYPYDLDKGVVTFTTGQNIASLPADGRHFTRTIAFSKNLRHDPLITGFEPLKGFTSVDKLYISVGSSCDVCLENTWKRSAILETDPEGSYAAEFAGGLRNSVFFTFHPQTGELWATEMGRDNLGDDLPPDEINIVRANKKYGWPFCYGQQVRDKKFSVDKIDRKDLTDDCSKTESSVIDIPAHSAPLGLAFVNQQNWPAEWQNNLLVAFHGSWNRSQPTGYKVVRYRFGEQGQVLGVDDFVSGWYDPSTDSGRGGVYGRPVDLKFNNKGDLFITDDQAGLIYLIKLKTKN